MTLESLLEVLPPPKDPVETGGEEAWLSFQKTFGVALPTDYKQYINTYGSGCVGAFIWPLNPFSKNKHLNLTNQVKAQLDALRFLKEKWGSVEVPYPLFPEAGGLMPWGLTDNGDVLFWRTIGPPDNWPTVINEARAPVYEEFEASMTSLLMQFVLGEVTSTIFPPDFLDRDALFVPAGSRESR